MNRRKFMIGLVSAIPALATIKYATANALDLVPKTDRSRELLILTKAVRDSYANGDSDFNQRLEAFFHHCNTEFDSKLISKQDVKNIFLYKNLSLEEDQFKIGCEAHPIAALRELLHVNDVVFDPSNSAGYKLYAANYASVVVEL